MPAYKTNSSVIFCIFNRPETTQRVFKQIAEAQPPKLYLIADAPRPNKAGEAELCRQARAIAENITWDCELTLDYADTNLGCRERIYSGISNAFKVYEFAIILEDDCYPSNVFSASWTPCETDTQMTLVSHTLVAPHSSDLSIQAIVITEATSRSFGAGQLGRSIGSLST